jgi:hypothetical protein
MRRERLNSHGARIIYPRSEVARSVGSLGGGEGAHSCGTTEVIFVIFPLSGQVAEWLKAPVSKTGIPATVS